MLSDRDYMRPGRRNRQENRVAPGGTTVVFMLLAINIIIPLIFGFNNNLSVKLGLSGEGIKEMRIWQLITYMFLHGGMAHLLLNMWGLYLFGTVVAEKLGANRFLILYFLSGVTGGLLWLGFNFNSYSYCIGASAAVFGVMMAAAMLVPNMQILLLIPPIPMKMKTMVVVYALIEIFSSTGGGSVAHLAHVGGLIGAYIYLKIIYGNGVWDPLNFLWRAIGLGSRPTIGRNIPFPGQGGNSYSRPPSSVSQAELDRILDKISVHGINSLSQGEMEALRRAREEMKGGN